MILSKVDLPLPDGPRKAMNSRLLEPQAAHVVEQTGVAPNALRTPSARDLAKQLSRRPAIYKLGMARQ